MSMTDMEKCTTYKRRGDVCTISCKLGNWSVSGPYGMQIINEASRYFEQYKQDGEYDGLLGGAVEWTPEKKAELDRVIKEIVYELNERAE